MTWLNKPNTVREPPPQSNNTPQHAAALPSKDKAIDQDVANEKKQTLATTPNMTPLPPNVELRPCTKDDIPHLKRLISLLLPIPYSDKFFREIIEDPLINNITLLALWHDDVSLKAAQKCRLVGAIRCRLLAHPPSPSQTDGPMLYLSTLALLSPYRGHGIAAHLLHTLTRRAIEDYGISSVGAHVWEANELGLEWYRKRGFREVGREEGYYRRLEPKGAVVMQRDVSVMDLLGKG
ncbi:hypothetical protein M409DRAFT_17551 [Zasmidium cellare ATCC 36951]|uniref:N-acetyltransferase domain-containing protein n=1 Tax=Zasmidium cellare ATCC 36951 TaxID=1080233 RepID=A0A6A6CZ51_ZASCE|nr:uncharacterized protein M409DRAFT_17551 [Zasmidium cellare ATCC 36951]KAF2172315.1 hypothetical protein M409DRAFT_17551 [Zasmidium cellare ATCC 36951]